MEVCWSLAEDLERICERIERDNPEAARRIVRTIYGGCARLKDFPRLGRASNRMTGRRALVFSPLPYGHSLRRVTCVADLEVYPTNSYCSQTRLGTPPSRSFTRS